MPVARKHQAFLDSNVMLYLLSEDSAKADATEGLLKAGPVISVQVLNEVTHVCVRKLKMAWDEVAQFLDLIRSFCKVVPLTVEVHDRARHIAQRYQLSFYDACIVSAAIGAGCITLYSEDMNHGQTFEESLSLRNPFASGIRGA